MPVILAASLAAFDAPISAQRMGNRESNWISASGLYLFYHLQKLILQIPLSDGSYQVLRYPLISFGIESVWIVSNTLVNSLARQTSRLSPNIACISVKVANIRLGDS